MSNERITVVFEFSPSQMACLQELCQLEEAFLGTPLTPNRALSKYGTSFVKVLDYLRSLNRGPARNLDE